MMTITTIATLPAATKCFFFLAAVLQAMTTSSAKSLSTVLLRRGTRSSVLSVRASAQETPVLLAGTRDGEGGEIGGHTARRIVAACKNICAKKKRSNLKKCRRAKKCGQKRSAKAKRACSSSCVKPTKRKRRICVDACNKMSPGKNEDESEASSGSSLHIACQRLYSPIKCTRGGPPPPVTGVTPDTEWFANPCKAAHQNGFDETTECLKCDSPAVGGRWVKCDVNDPETESSMFPTQCHAEFSGYFSGDCQRSAAPWCGSEPMIPVVCGGAGGEQFDNLCTATTLADYAESNCTTVLR